MLGNIILEVFYSHNSIFDRREAGKTEQKRDSLSFAMLTSRKRGQTNNIRELKNKKWNSGK